MKILLLKLVAIASFLIIGNAHLQAQPSIEPVDPPSVVYGITSDFLVQAGFDVRNNTSAPLDVLVRRTTISAIEGTLNYFCWEQCYAPGTNLSPTSVTIPAGGTVPNFYADYQPFETSGSTFVQYCFFEQGNETNETCVIIEYQVSTAVSVNNPSDLIELSEARPNPALDGFTNIPFVLKEANRQASVVVYNLLGSEVIRVRVNGTSGIINLDLSGLNSGLYIYSFFNGNALLSSKRVVVN